MALMLIVIALFALVSMQAHSMKSLNDTRETYFAGVLAANFMAEAEAKLEEDFEASLNRPLAPVVDHSEYSAQVTVVEVDPELKKIRVEVKWSEGPSSAHKILETTVAKPL